MADSRDNAIADGDPFEVVVVTYRSAQAMIGLLEMLKPDQPLAVVDNAQGADRMSELLAGRPKTRYLHGPAEGFAVAANIGCRSSNYDYVVFCNPDVRPEPEALSQLVATVSGERTRATCSALLVGPDGRSQLGNAGWEPTLRRAAVHAVGAHRLWRTGGIVARPEPHSQIAVGWMTGACLAVRRSVFLDVGGFDEAFYVYSEDVALGRALRAGGLTQVLRTDVVVPHARGGSGAPSAEMNRLKGASMALYLERHNTPARAAGIRGLLALGYILRLLERLIRLDAAVARQHWAYLRGLTTRRAQVGGRQVVPR